MNEIIRQTLYNCRSAYNLIHGPEIWLGLVAWCALSVAVVIGMWLAALLSANKEDDDDR